MLPCVGPELVMAEPLSLPSFLQRTPAELAEDAKLQDIRRASFTRARLTEAERLIGRGKLLEETALANLQAALQDKNSEQVELEKTNLANARAMCGDYAGAAKIPSR